MSDTTSGDDTIDPTGTPHLGSDSDPLDSGTAVPVDADPASRTPGQADGGRPDGDPAAQVSERSAGEGSASDGSAATEVASGTPQSVVPPTQNSDDPRT
jgi:hypothetical protein